MYGMTFFQTNEREKIDDDDDINDDDINGIFFSSFFRCCPHHHHHHNQYDPNEEKASDHLHYNHRSHKQYYE